MVETYGDIQVLIYVTAIGGGLCLVWCLYLILLKREATQQEYLNFWGVTLLVLCVTAVLLGLLVHSMSTSYNAKRNQLPVIGNCITNLKWRAVTTAMYDQSNMETEHNWAIAFLTFSILFIIAMLVVFVRVSQGLEQINAAKGAPLGY